MHAMHHDIARPLPASGSDTGVLRVGAKCVCVFMILISLPAYIISDEVFRVRPSALRSMPGPCTRTSLSYFEAYRSVVVLIGTGTAVHWVLRFSPQTSVHVTTGFSGRPFRQRSSLATGYDPHGLRTRTARRA